MRRHNHGRDVVAVEYDLFEPLARATFDAIAHESFADVTPELRVYVAHAHGPARCRRHRGRGRRWQPPSRRAFRACRAVIEGVKHRAPIWKREHYLDGSSEWSGDVRSVAKAGSGEPDGGLGPGSGAMPDRIRIAWKARTRPSMAVALRAFSALALRRRAALRELREGLGDRGLVRQDVEHPPCSNVGLTTCW